MNIKKTSPATKCTNRPRLHRAFTVSRNGQKGWSPPPWQRRRITRRKWLVVCSYPQDRWSDEAIRSEDVGRWGVRRLAGAPACGAWGPPSGGLGHPLELTWRPRAASRSPNRYTASWSVFVCRVYVPYVVLWHAVVSCGWWCAGVLWGWWRWVGGDSVWNGKWFFVFRVMWDIVNGIMLIICFDCFRKILAVSTLNNFVFCLILFG